jgi:hypothetical protein
VSHGGEWRCRGGLRRWRPAQLRLAGPIQVAPAGCLPGAAPAPPALSPKDTRDSAQYRASNHPHSSLDDITPNEAIYDEKKRVHVLHLNIQKGEQNWFTTDLKAGDKVRIDDTAMFKKGSENRWSDKIYTVAAAMGKTVALTDGTMHKRDKVLLVPNHTEETTTEKNVIKIATKQHKDKLHFKREDLNKENIIEGKRTRKN